MDESAYLESLADKPVAKRAWGYLRLSGPGYMQSAMTLGGGSVASCAALGSLLGYELLWVQPLAMLLGYFVLASVAKQTTHTSERPYGVFWNKLHPSLAILWGVSALVATLLWHIPQYSLTADGVVTLAEGINVNLEPRGTRILIGLFVLAAATFVVWLYNQGGARGLKFYETAVKTLVWAIVASFALVVLSTGVNWREFFLGITGVTFIRDLTDGNGLDPDAIGPIVGGLAATVGINMIFIYPYSLLNKKWDRRYKELAYFDLLSGMALPFILATGLMILAVANTIGPAPGDVGSTLPSGDKMVKDIRQIIPVLAPTFGNWFGADGGAGVARLLIGFGMTAIGFSTIITHMLASGFICCEMFGRAHEGRARFWFSMLPAIGVIGVTFPFPIPLAITASTLAVPLMPVAVICFMILLNRKDYMGEARPKGVYLLVWNVMLTASVVIMSVAAYFALRGNVQSLQKWMTPEPTEAAAAVMDEAARVPVRPDEPGIAAGSSFALLDRPLSWDARAVAVDPFQDSDSEEAVKA